MGRRPRPPRKAPPRPLRRRPLRERTGRNLLPHRQSGPTRRRRRGPRQGRRLRRQLIRLRQISRPAMSDYHFATVNYHFTHDGHDNLGRPDLSVVIPFYNEASNIAPLLAELRATVETLQLRAEIVCVDDGSSDATPLELATAARAW